jgi:N-acetylglucosaminyldiphosphoundecaprenol N-acetyl-beta-D-mannosaminyltransferase
VHRNREALGPCWALCLGQAVRVELGLTRRAPAFWQRCGLEAVWRIAQEPRRLTGRYVKALAWFPVAVARDLLGQGTSATS